MKPEKEWPLDADGKPLPLLTLELRVRNGGDAGDGRMRILYDFRANFRTGDFALTPEEALKALLAVHEALTRTHSTFGIDLIWSATGRRGKSE